MHRYSSRQLGLTLYISESQMQGLQKGGGTLLKLRRA